MLIIYKNFYNDTGSLYTGVMHSQYVVFGIVYNADCAEYYTDHDDIYMYQDGIHVLDDYIIKPYRNTALLDAYFSVLRNWDEIKKIRAEHLKAKEILHSVDDRLWYVTGGNLRLN
jgi:hypothetical protein